jgi:hypothetical protein
MRESEKPFDSVMRVHSESGGLDRGVELLYGASGEDE